MVYHYNNQALSGEKEGMMNDERHREWPPRMAVCVGSMVVREGRALLIRQAAGQSLAGQWSIPWGVVESGETPEEAALRETREEGGIDAVIDGLLGIQNLPEEGWLGIIFRCHPLAGEPRSDGIETDRAGYFSAEEITAFKEPIEPWCRWLALRVLAGKNALVAEAEDTPYYPKRAFL